MLHQTDGGGGAVGYRNKGADRQAGSRVTDWLLVVYWLWSCREPVCLSAPIDLAVRPVCRCCAVSNERVSSIVSCDAANAQLRTKGPIIKSTLKPAVREKPLIRTTGTEETTDACSV